MIFLFLCLTYFPQYDALQVYPCHCKWHYFILFRGQFIFHCIYVPHFPNAFLCQWTSRLLPCLGYCKQCCSLHWDTCILLDNGFLQIYAQDWDCRVLRQFCFQFFKEPPYCSLQWLSSLHSHSALFPGDDLTTCFSTISLS